MKKIINLCVGTILAVNVLAVGGWAEEKKAVTSSQEKIEFTSKELIFAEWGSGEGQFILIGTHTEKTSSGEITIYIGPGRIRVNNKKIYVKNRYRIFIFTEEGKFLKTLQIKPFDDFDVDESGNIYTYDASFRRYGDEPASPDRDFDLIAEYNSEGVWQKEYKIPTLLQKGFWMIRFMKMERYFFLQQKELKKK